MGSMLDPSGSKREVSVLSEAKIAPPEANRIPAARWGMRSVRNDSYGSRPPPLIWETYSVAETQGAL